MIAIPQHMAALERANTLRHDRFELRREVIDLGRFAGAERVAGLLLDPPDEIGTLAIFDLLCWVHRIGRSQARGILNTVGPITERRRIQDLTSRQRVALARYLRGEEWEL